MTQESLHFMIAECIKEYKILIDLLCKNADEEMKNISEVASSSSADLSYQKNLQDLYLTELKLNSLLNDVEEHQALNDIINRLQNDCELKTQTHRKITESLFERIENFSNLLEHGKSLLSTNRSDATYEPIDVNELLLYSSRVARHTLSALTPPIPQDDQMRSSKLFAVGDKLYQNRDNLDETIKYIPDESEKDLKIDLGLGETGGFVVSGAQDGTILENDSEELLDLF